MPSPSTLTAKPSHNNLDNVNPWVSHRHGPSLGGKVGGFRLVVPVLSVFGAKLARAIAFSTVAERVWDLAIPMAYRACVKISMASMTGSHHYLPPMCSESEPDATSRRRASRDEVSLLSRFIRKPSYRAKRLPPCWRLI